MPIVKTDSRYYTDIANAINRKNGKNKKYTPAEMATEIDELPVIKYEPLEYITIMKGSSGMGGFFLNQNFNDFNKMEFKIASTSVYTTSDRFMPINSRNGYSIGDYAGMNITIDSSGTAASSYFPDKNITPNLKITEYGDTQPHEFVLGYSHSRPLDDNVKPYINGYSNFWARDTKWYYLRLYKENTLVANIVPVKLQGKNPVFLDLISKSIYLCDGVGQFLMPEEQPAQSLVETPVDGDEGHTNVVYSDETGRSNEMEGMTPEEIAEIERIRRENGIGV